jgi:hypothetical protein
MMRIACMAVVGVLPVCSAVGVSQALQCSLEGGALTLHVERAGVATPLVRGLSYVARTAQGVAFETGAATLDASGRLDFALSGPDATAARVSAQITPRPHGVVLAWRIEYSGPARLWDGGSSGIRLEFATPPTEARTQPVTRWVKPTGALPWEVAGDTPYPDTECQVRAVQFGDTTLAMVASAYDPDWIYGANLERAHFARLAPAPEVPGVQTAQLAFLVAPADDLDPARLAAEAAGRPLALSLHSQRTGNLFAPGEPVVFDCIVSNVTAQDGAAKLDVEAWSYRGERLSSDRTDLALAPFGGQTLRRELRVAQRGVVFIAARLSWDGGEILQRATLGILPERRATGTLASSPFGMAAITANPTAYPDHHDLATVLGLAERVGVRWIRGGWFPLKAEITDRDEQQVRERVAVLTQHGVLPHVQLGSGVPKAEELDAYRQALAASLQRFAWVTPYIEVGNELNASTAAADYVEKMLRPTHETMRRVCPQGKVMTMGLGGAMKEWLDAFGQAGGAELCDVLSVHPGCQPRAPEYFEGWRGWVFRPQMLDSMRLAREHGAKEVWITEAYAPTPPGPSGVDLRTSADYLVRTYVCALALGVKVVEWYQFQDGVWFAQRPNPADAEYNFGVLYTDLTPKPAYVAFGAMTEQLEGARCLGRLDLGAPDLYGVRFEQGGQPLDVLWSYREKHETDLPWWPPEKYARDSRRPGEPWVERWQAPVTLELAAAGPVTVIDTMGNPETRQPAAGKITLSLSGSPVYVRGLGPIAKLNRLWDEIP